MSDHSAPDHAALDDTAAHLAASTPAEIDAAVTAAVATSTTLITAVTTGAGTGIDRLAGYDEAIATLGNLNGLLGLVSRSNPSADMRAAAEAGIGVLSARLSALSLDPDLYRAINAIDVTAEDAATRYYVAKTLRDFRQSGVDRDEATRARVRELNDDLTRIGIEFSRNIMDDVRTGHVPTSALDALPADYVRAHPPGPDGTVAITTEYPDYRPFLSYCADAGAREEMWRQYHRRGYPSNVDVLRSLLERRHELATLLGYDSWAQYATSDKMIGSAAAATDFIATISNAAAGRCAADYADLLDRKRADDPAATAVHPWDTAYLQDLRKSETLAIDTQALRPYFEYTRVKTGLLRLVERMFGLEFRAAPRVPRWHPDVDVFDVVGADSGEPLGRIFLDMHPRPGKYQHAQMAGMVTGNAARGRLPECALLCNLPAPGAEPALLLHSDVTTFFHEFGHLIHFILGGHQRWSGISGIRNERDFVEAPSQLLEEWTFDAGTLAEFAVHHQTGEPLPATMVARLREAAEYGKGLSVRQQMYYATLSLALHLGDPAVTDPVDVDRAAMALRTPFQPVDGAYTHLSFGHLTAYSATYYTYMWSLVIAKDLFTRFADEGLPAPVAVRAYRDAVLAPGGSAPAADLVRDFLGREYTFDAYRRWLDAA